MSRPERVGLPLDQRSELIALRRRLHHHPELRFAEVGTAETIHRHLAGFYDRGSTGVAGTGIVVEIDGAAPGPKVLLRADMDAYPVQDAKLASYASDNPWATHACGHDVHMAVLVGALRRLAMDRPQRGSVVGLFQPAEEIPYGESSGARAVLETGALGSNPYAAVLGMHCWPDLDAGAIGLDPVVSMAAKDAFRIDVTGVSAHAATPARGRDAILALSSLVTDLHAVAARRRDPGEMLALNIGTIQGGTGQSAVPAHSWITGTLRSHVPELRQRMKTIIDAVCQGIALQFDVRVDLQWANSMDAVINSPWLVELAHRELPAVADVVSMEPPMTTDDFAILTNLGPSLYFKLGVHSPGATIAAPLHSPVFDVDERCIDVGVRALELLCRRVLDGSMISRKVDEVDNIAAPPAKQADRSLE